MTKSTLLFEMIDLLKAHPGITVSQLAARLGRSERSIYRWLKEISNGLGVRMRCTEGGYYLLDTPPSGAGGLSAEELLAVRLSLRSAPFLDGSPVSKHAASAWSKIRDSAAAEKLDTMGDLITRHAVGAHASQAQIRPEIVDVIERAVSSHNRLDIVYRSQKSDQVKEYTIDPYAVVFRRHSWYVVAHSHEHGKIVQFKLVRFRDAVETGEQFDPPADFSVDDYFRLSWEAWAGGEPVEVKVRFSPRVARMISETKRHSTQVVHAKPDGSVLFEVRVSGMEEIAAWIMGYGKDAVVLSPKALRDYVLDHARNTVQNYSPKQDLRPIPPGIIPGGIKPAAEQRGTRNQGRGRS